jgi:hypothetical protein
LASALVLAAGCATAPNPVAAADSGRLVITRSFALAGLPVALVVDGVRVATIDFHSSYDRPIAPGPHTINVLQIPSSERSLSEVIHLVVRRGQTYRFTATRVGPRIVLR